MEFRIFLPVFHSRDQSWISNENISLYNDILSRLKAMAADSREEVRSDIYFVTPDHIGLKYRHGNMLELKVRGRELDGSGMEAWTKFKLREGEISSCESDILNILRHSGYPADELGFSLNKKIELSKRRKQVYLSNYVVYEYCLCTERASPESREWISLAIEGNPLEMRKILFCKDDLFGIQAAIRTIHDLLKPSLDAAVRNNFVPMVAGYPQFVRYISDMLSSDEVRANLLGTWENLSNRIGKD